MRRVLSISALALLLTVLLSGCLFKGAEELYTLPELSEDYTNLQDEVEALVNSGLEYAAPKAGDNAQAIQFRDLDGDGQSEVLAFFRDTNADNGKPLRIYIYRKTEAGLYEQAAEIEGEGSAFHSIEYVALDDSDAVSLVVNYQISDQVYSLSVYAIQEDTASLLMQSGCSDYAVADLNGDGVNELVLLRLDSTGETGDRAEWYLGSDGALPLEGTAALSDGIGSITRTRSSKLAEGETAVFVTGTYGDDGDDLITDIIALRDGELTNLTLDEEEGISTSTLREDPGDDIFATDINSDGIYEIPLATELTALGSSDIWQVDWMQYHLDGTAERICTTLCAPEDGDGWYLELPDEFWERFSGTLGALRTESSTNEEIIVTLYDCSDTQNMESEALGVEDVYTPLLSVYTISGANRSVRARLTGRYTLYEGSDTIYAFSLETASGLTQTQVEDGFGLMPTGWSE